MATSPEHFRYADALITSAINAYGSKGDKAKKRDMIAGATPAARRSSAAAIKKDKILRPSRPPSWNSATAIEINKRIQDIVWKEVTKAYKKAKRKRTDVDPLLFGDEILPAALFGVAAKNQNSQQALSRRSFVGAIVLGGVALTLLDTDAANAANNSLVREVSRDIKSYVRGKSAEIEARLAAALR
ncbi:MAG: hypothetical protein AAGA76_13580 [Pseudomonadota bacterium]